MARVVRLWQYGAPSGGGSVMNYRPVAGWGRLPEGWSYVEATSVAVDAADNVYVFNRGAHPVIVFDRDGNFRRAWGEGTFRRPTRRLRSRAVSRSTGRPTWRSARRPATSTSPTAMATRACTST